MEYWVLPDPPPRGHPLHHSITPLLHYPITPSLSEDVCRRFERVRRDLDSFCLHPFDGARPQAGGDVPAKHFPIGGGAGLVETEDVLQDDDVPFHPLDLRDVRDAAAAVAEAA